MTFSSVYEILTPITTVRKTKFWDWFDGDDLRAIWTTRNITGTGTFAMSDVADDGFTVQSGATSSDESRIDFNSIRHYLQTACVFIGVMKAVSNSSSAQYCGLVNPTTTYDGIDRAIFVLDTANSNTSLRTADGSTSSETTTDVVNDTNFHSVKIECSSANIKLTQDGVLKVTKTTNRPTTRLEPNFGVKTTSAAAKALRARYCEVYNT